MPPRLRMTLIPQCLSCARSYVEAATVGWRPLFGAVGQTRGIAKDKDKSISVQLLKPKAGYGKAGRYVPVARGVMRNIWFPSKIARYAVDDELKAIKDGKIVVERDYEFEVQKQPEMVKLEVEIEDVEVEVPYEAPKVEGIQPQRAMDLIGVLLPQKLEFVRAPRSDAPDAIDQTVPIFGSVSTADIVQEIRSLLSHNDEAARITLDEDDIEFMDVKLEDPSRIKHLGVFPIKILVKGSDQWPVERKIQVVAQGES
ncbi:putative prephenate dehydrogenase [NADP(+)] [Venturia nashicola]|uniref:Putative prephenate dehydrogenase [NADP(+)] n=1 Tax=Venturia nashicola TaxID=86259 RepID=A0A4Z1PPM2_9PEZI|nr:putative prephenate dehydrogenase [NADP(+)] [Venturia nashicola]TLD37139.1 putative prephenate dehydrogenase [NADP(+)] [Venturia nashicola]